MTSRSFYINTMGCQMNVYDSSKMATMLTSLGYRPAASVNNADMVIVNTCTIRSKARQKAASFLGRLAVRKRKNPDMIIAVAGCVAQEEGRRLLSQFAHVDLVFGTRAISRLPELLETVRSKNTRLIDIDMTETAPSALFQCLPHKAEISEFVTVIQGCDNYCTYCVVPYVRGRETSRPPDEILREIRGLVAAGAHEVTLLGQNVNSYGQKENFCSFARLLARVDDIQGLKRIRFATSHPKDLSRELARTFEKLDKLCNHFHLPVQSGSNRILKRMNRKYTREQYLEKIGWLREFRPDIALSTDIIAGFPGETEADFEQTLNLLQVVEFDAIFAFMYSDRAVAPASKFSDKIPEAMKHRRLKTVLALQEAISRKKNRACEGRTESVLVEGLSKTAAARQKAAGASPLQWTGRTTTNKVVNFTADTASREKTALNPGCFVKVAIERGFTHSLAGKAVVIEKQTTGAGGVYAA